jgi:hypothetical protein
MGAAQNTTYDHLNKKISAAPQTVLFPERLSGPGTGRIAGKTARVKF